jgi:serine/threonine-protein kinase
MGQVWAAKHEVTGKEVALKLLKSERDEDRKRLLREARAACTVKHPGIAVVHDVTELDDGSPLLVMDLLEGEPLRSRLLRGALPLDETAKILSQVASAVGAAHARGIVHRDLKPDNVFLCADGTVKVLDFGVAKVITTDHDADAAGLTASGSMLGTPYYMAPEQAFGEKDVDARADLWALGVMIYECLSGERPTQADNLGQILKIITTRSFRPLGDRVEGLPHEIASLVERCMRLDKSDRPQSTDEIIRALEPFTHGGVPRLVVTPRNDEEPSTALASTVRAVPSAPKLVEAAVPPPKNTPRWPFIATGAIVVSSALGLWAMSRKTPAPAPSAPEIAISIAPEPAPSQAPSNMPVVSASALPVPPRIVVRPAATTSASTAPTESTRRTKVVTDPPF